jgi:hypothetical protein
VLLVVRRCCCIPSTQSVTLTCLQDDARTMALP